MIENAFSTIEYINEQLDIDVLEVSVKKSQIVFTFADGLMISMKDLLALHRLDKKYGVTDVTCFQNRLYVAIRDIDSIESGSVYEYFYEIITVLRDLVCTCPALEYIISKEYIKVFLDVPNIQVSSLWKLVDVFKQDPFVEFSGDRPYLLFINEDMYVSEEIA